jgi:hypothetical protein
MIVKVEYLRSWKEMAIVYLKVISRHMLKETEKNHKNPHSG